MIKECEIIQCLKTGIIQWYDFRNNSSILCLEEDEICVELSNKGHKCINCQMGNIFQVENDMKFVHCFDYIIAINKFQRSLNPLELLIHFKNMLKEDGIILIGIDNKFGLRYFCGESDPFTCKVFDGIENYRRYSKDDLEKLGGRLYSKFEIISLIEKAGFSVCKNYAVLPNNDMAQLLFAEGYDPVEDLAMRLFPIYNTPDTVFLHEELLYKEIIENGMFHQLANSYLFEITNIGKISSATYVTLSSDRGKEHAMSTVIKKEGIVEKFSNYDEGFTKIEKLYLYMKKLQSRGLKVVDFEINRKRFIMPFIKEKLGNVYLQDLLKTDKNKFIIEMDHYRDNILNSSPWVKENELGIILEEGYIDLVPINSFVINGEFVFFDQEFVIKNYPANAILFRSISIIYADDISRNEILPIDFLWKRYGLEKNKSLWIELSRNFTENLRNQEMLSAYLNSKTRIDWIADFNKEHLNDTDTFYEQTFINSCFKWIDDKILYLYGINDNTEKFLLNYGKYLNIKAVIDDNIEHPKEFMGIKIEGKDCLKTLPENYKIIVCHKDYKKVVKKLITMGINCIGIYDSTYDYSQYIKRESNKE